MRIRNGPVSAPPFRSNPTIRNFIITWPAPSSEKVNGIRQYRSSRRLFASTTTRRNLALTGPGADLAGQTCRRQGAVDHIVAARTGQPGWPHELGTAPDCRNKFPWAEALATFLPKPPGSTPPTALVRAHLAITFEKTGATEQAVGHTWRRSAWIQGCRSC